MNSLNKTFNTNSNIEYFFLTKKNLLLEDSLKRKTIKLKYGDLLCVLQSKIIDSSGSDESLFVQKEYTIIHNRKLFCFEILEQTFSLITKKICGYNGKK